MLERTHSRAYGHKRTASAGLRSCLRAVRGQRRLGSALPKTARSNAGEVAILVVHNLQTVDRGAAGFDMTATLVTVFGGSGFLGQHIVKRLAAQGARVRMAIRHPNAVVDALSDNGRIVAVYADVLEERSVAQAIEGAEAVVNAVSLYVERRDATFRKYTFGEPST